MRERRVGSIDYRRLHVVVATTAQRATHLWYMFSIDYSATTAGCVIFWTNGEKHGLVLIVVGVSKNTQDIIVRYIRWLSLSLPSFSHPARIC